jgi:hypothetical protein
MSFKKRPIDSVDLLQDQGGALVIRDALAGKGKPDLLVWDSGSDLYAEPVSGTVSHEASVVFIRIAAGGALVSIADEAGNETPFVIPPNYWREIIIPGGIPAGSRIVAKNLTAGANFRDLMVEVR